MAQLQLQPVSIGKKNRARKAQLKIDMTPMVDLGFLLITFFIFTTAMSNTYETDLYMPAGEPDIDGGTIIGKSNALTILLNGNDSIYYYQGKWNEAIVSNQVHLTNYDSKSGIRNIIQEKQKLLADKRNELLIMIKPLDNSTYNDLMNSLDEIMINDVKKYAIMDVTEEEKNWVAQQSDPRVFK